MVAVGGEVAEWQRGVVTMVAVVTVVEGVTMAYGDEL